MHAGAATEVSNTTLTEQRIRLGAHLRGVLVLGGVGAQRQHGALERRAVRCGETWRETGQ
jgi:hypothetical protein